MSIAAAEIAQQAASKVPIKIGGTVIIKDDHATPDEIETLQKSNISVREASHPVPDARSVTGAKEILQAASSAEERTLIIVCISGGGSALFCSPRDPLSLDDLMATNSALLASGMPIEKMNVIRKRLENGKGGRLAAAAYPATVVTLILSDIVGDPLDLIASGPTVPDGSGWDEANEIVKEYGLGIGGDHELPSGVLELLQMGLDGGVDDTPKEDNPAFSVNESSSTKYTENVLVGNNYASVMAAADQAKRLGYHPVVLGTRVEGEASCVAGMYVAMAEMLTQQRGNNDDKSLYGIGQLPVALIAGGETTVTLPPNSKGKGGRNQELALVAAVKLQEIGLRDVVLASVGTDGTDGPTGKSIDVLLSCYCLTK
jgi:glycerate-2-kinase